MHTTVQQENLLSRLSQHFASLGHAADPARKQAMDLLLTKGLPNARTEEYRFAPVVRVIEESATFSAPTSVSVDQPLTTIPELTFNRIVFINGRYAPAHSQFPDSGALTLRQVSIPTPRKEQDPFDLLNLAFAEEVIHLEVADHQQALHPIAIVHYINSPEYVFANPRWSLTIGTGSKATVLEYSEIPNGLACFHNKQSAIRVKERGTVELVTIQQARNEVQVNNTEVNLADAAQAFSYTLTLDGKLIRNNLTFLLDGEGIDAHLHGLYLATGSVFIDNHTVVDHRKPNSSSNELYKGVLDGRGKAVFNGKIFVRPDAQKTNAFQSNRNILLSEGSTIHTKPQLEIWADDVKCSHGCTTGQLDEEALFYLRSRGIPKDAARGLLLSAFAGETLEGIQDLTLRAYVGELMLKKLHTSENG